MDLTPKAFTLLVVLARHSGEFLSRERLLETLWAGLYVDDHALSMQIREIRRALGDNAGAPRFIVTRYRRGYCFLAPVRYESRTAGRAFSPAPPETRYAPSGPVNIAYQVLGEGPLDFVFVMGWSPTWNGSGPNRALRASFAN